MQVQTYEEFNFRLCSMHKGSDEQEYAGENALGLVGKIKNAHTTSAMALSI